MSLHVVPVNHVVPFPVTEASDEPGERTEHPDHPAGHARGLDPDAGAAALATITKPTSIRPALSPLGPPEGFHRPTPFESGLAAVARQDVHIERVWPMRSPSTGTLGESSSALPQGDRSGTPPAKIVPVEGLRMSHGPSSDENSSPQPSPEESSLEEPPQQAFTHQPVMTAEVVDQFALVPPGPVVDATVGGGGHAAALLTAHAGLTVLGIDRDPMAVAAATEALAPFGRRATVRQSRFDALGQVVRETVAASDQSTGQRLSGVLFDLGVSSPQLDTAGRGFSYRRDAFLDMRMDPTSGRTAADVVNEYDEDAMVQIFTDNGEGRFARRIARAIVAARPLTTTGQLADVVREAIPAATRRTGGHPARRVFQAIRIAVNEELDQLATALDDALDLLVPGGRCVVIAYHSGEDRLVKSMFMSRSTDDCRCPPGLPCVCGADPKFRLITRGARRPTADEIEHNRRAEAARLRVIERLPNDSASERSDPSTSRDVL